MNIFKIFTNGIVKENPVFILVLGICPALAITTSLTNAIGMSAATIFVLVLSDFFISLFRNFIPSKTITITAIIVIATFVTIADMLMKVIAPELDKALGIYLPLIVLNCIILSRAENFAYHNKIIPSLLDALGMGFGFAIAIILTGSIREILGNGSIMDYKLVNESTRTILFFILPPGAFIVFAYMIALAKNILKKTDK